MGCECVCCAALHHPHVHPGDMRQTKAASVVSASETRERARAWLRLCMRAWRECADGRKVYAGEWAERWARACAGEGGCELAMRTLITDGSQRLWDEAGWPVRVLFGRYRLVRANKILESKTARARAAAVQHAEQQGAYEPRRQPAASGSDDVALPAEQHGRYACKTHATRTNRRARCASQRGTHATPTV